MANIKSAEKKNRQRLKRRARNVHHLNTMRTYVKKARTAIEDAPGDAKSALQAAVSVIDKVAQKGVIKKAAAARKISRLAKALNRATAAAAQ